MPTRHFKRPKNLPKSFQKVTQRPYDQIAVFKFWSYARWGSKKQQKVATGHFKLPKNRLKRLPKVAQRPYDQIAIFKFWSYAHWGPKKQARVPTRHFKRPQNRPKASKKVWFSDISDSLSNQEWWSSNISRIPGFKSEQKSILIYFHAPKCIVWQTYIFMYCTSLPSTGLRLEYYISNTTEPRNNENFIMTLPSPKNPKNSN